MEISEKQYKELFSYACVITARTPHILAEDAVNEALLSFLESGKTYDHQGIKHLISNYVLNKKFNERNLKDDKKFSKFETDRHCKKCNEVLPIAMFRLITNKYGVQVIYSYCSPCWSKYSNIQQKKARKADPQKRIDYNNRMKEWRLKNPEKWLEIRRAAESKRAELGYKKEYYKKNRDMILLRARMAHARKKAA